MKVSTVAARLFLGLLALMLLAAAGTYGISEWMLQRRHEIPLEPLSGAGSPTDQVEGRRKAILIGCLEGCHGREGGGGEEGAPGIFRAAAPTLSAVLPLYSDPELVRVIRFGVKRDGRTALGMPSATFYPLSDGDLRVVIGHLRGRPPMPVTPAAREVTFIGRLALVLGKWHTSADAVDRSRPRWGHRSRATPRERGRYLASVICSECHGQELEGDEFMNSPPLSMVRGYSIEQFRHLLRTGEPISPRDLGIMSTVARQAFVHFTDDEVGDLYAYLGTRQPTRAARRDAAY